MAGVAESRTWDALLTSTFANYGDKKLHDNIFDEVPLLSWFDGKLAGAMKREKLKKLLDGGESIVVRVSYELSSAIKSYVGYEALDLTPQEGQTIARFSWRQKAAGISISGLERRSNSGDAKLGDLLEDKVQQAENTIRDVMSRDFWGSNADGKSVDGLGLILSTTATIGGLAPATYAWWAPTSTASGSFAAQGLKDMRTLYNTLSFGQNTPDGLFTTQAIFEFYENALQPLQRYADEGAANSGFENLKFKAKPLFFDRDCTSGQVVMLNSRHIKLHVHKDADMATSPFVTPENQDASSSTILWQGNMVVNDRRKLGRLTAVVA
jgi:hypothetical protein